jgi:hypothetical protein
MTASSLVVSPAAIAVPRRGVAAGIYRWTARAYVLAIGIQVFLAGLFVFVGANLLPLHMTFAHVFIVLTTLLVGSALIGRLDGTRRRDALVMLGLIIVQGMLVHLRVVSPIISAFHPVNALLMFWWSTQVAKRA